MKTKILILINMFFWIGCSPRVMMPPADMVGHWRGECNPIVNWCAAENIHIQLDIAADGTVTGVIGDARLTDGIVKRNAAVNIWFGNPKLMIYGNLSGPLVKDEGISREGISFLVRIEGDHLTGEFNTSGSKGAPWGDKEKWKETMWMKCVDMQLHRVDSQP